MQTDPLRSWHFTLHHKPRQKTSDLNPSVCGRKKLGWRGERWWFNMFPIWGGITSVQDWHKYFTVEVRYERVLKHLHLESRIQHLVSTYIWNPIGPGLRSTGLGCCWNHLWMLRREWTWHRICLSHQWFILPLRGLDPNTGDPMW